MDGTEFFLCFRVEALLAHDLDGKLPLRVSFRREFQHGCKRHALALGAAHRLRLHDRVNLEYDLGGHTHSLYIAISYVKRNAAPTNPSRCPCSSPFLQWFSLPAPCHLHSCPPSSP